MNRLAIDVTLRHERASATPQGEAGRRPAPREGHHEDRARGETADRSLRGTQEWFARAVTSPDGGQGPEPEVEQRLTSGPMLTATERLAIYRRAYQLRLVECLADDYPVLQHALGDETFRELCAHYIGAHPSRGPNLNFFGRHMADVCRGGARALIREPDRAAFAADLATLEWGIVEVIHAPSADPLTLEGLRDVPPEAWAVARLVPNTSVRLLRFDYPVNEYLQAYRDGSAPDCAHAPGDRASHDDWPAARPSMTVVYRSGPTIWRMDLTPAMYEVLAAFVAGETLGVSLARAESALAGVDPAEAQQRVTYWFREWVASGLFVRVEW